MFRKAVLRLAPAPDMRLLAVLTGVLAATVAVALAVKLSFSGEAAMTVLSKLKVVLSFQYLDDSWTPMHAAIEAWLRGDARGLYGATFEAGTKFQYPPSAIFAALPAHALGLGPFSAVYRAVALAFFALVVISTQQILAREVPGQGRGPSPMARSAVGFVLIAALGLTFHPISRAIELGQIQIWLDGLFAAALMAWLSGARIAPGVLVGLICLIKPQLSLFLVWAALRREWRFAFALGITGAVGLALSVAVFGFEDHLAYVRVLSFLAERGESFYANQSINGLLNRIVGLSDPERYNNVIWRLDSFPPYNPLVRYGTLATSLIIMALAVIPRRRQGDDRRVLDFCVMALACTIASPVAWEHHYGVVFPIFAVALGAFWGRGRWLAALAVSYLAVGQFLPFVNLAAATPFNFVQSYVLAGGLLLMGLLYAAPGRDSKRTQATAP